ncbi:MAG: 50S ribosomal protein L21e [Candidatus Nanohaloarchaea archaeon]
MAQKSSGAQQGARKTLSKDSREKPTVNDHFKQFEEGEKAKIKINPSVPEGRIHMRYHGRTVQVVGERGDAYEVELNDKGKDKTLYIKPIHLMKVDQ